MPVPSNALHATQACVLVKAYENDRPVITDVALDVQLPNEQQITVVIAPNTNLDRVPDWTGWFTKDGVALSRPDACEHLEVCATVTALADAIARALPDVVLRPEG